MRVPVLACLLASALAHPAFGQGPLFRGPVLTAAVSADGECVPFGTVRVFGSPRFKSDRVVACDFSPDGTHVVAAADDGVTAWTYPGGKKVWTAAFSNPTWPSRVRYAADAADVWVYASTKTGAVIDRFDAANGHFRSRTELGSDIVYAATLTRGGAVYWATNESIHRATADRPRTHTVWRDATLPPQESVAFAVRDDGRYLGVVARGDLRVIDLTTDREVYATAFPPGLCSLTFAATAPRVVTLRSADEGIVLKAFDFAADQPGPGPETVVGEMHSGIQPTYMPHTVHPTPDGRSAVVNFFASGQCKAVDLTRGTVTGTLRTVADFTEHPPVVHPGGKAVAVCTNGLGFWALPDLAMLPHSAEFAGSRQWSPGRLAFSADGRELTYVPMALGGAARWDVASGRELRRWDGATAVALGLTPLGETDGDIGLPQSGRVFLDRSFVRIEPDPREDPDHPWVNDGSVPRLRFAVHCPGGGWRALPTRAYQASEITMTSDGRYALVTDAVRRTTILDTLSGRVEHAEEPPDQPGAPNVRTPYRGRDSLAVPHPAGRTFGVLDVNESHGQATGGYWSIGVFDFAGREVARYRGIGLVECWAWSSDGRQVAVLKKTGHPSESDYLVEVRRFPPEPLSPGVQFPVPPAVGLQFTPDGFAVVTTTSDERTPGRPRTGLQFWELASGQCRRVIDPVSAQSPAVFSPDGRRLAGLTISGRPFVIGLDEDFPPPTPADLAAGWDALAGSDAVAADRAIRLFRQYRRVAEPFARRQPPDPPFDPAPVRRRLADLASPRYAVRVAAEVELSNATRSERAEMVRALVAAKSTEVRERLTALLDRPPPPDAPALRAARLAEAFADTARTR